jgi:hypothetical protein
VLSAHESTGGFGLSTFALVLLMSAVTADAQQPPPDASALAKQTQNPVANLISVPFQFNFNSAGDLGDGTLFNLNIQPVVPFRLTSKVNVIARTIVPVNSAPGPDGTRFSGIGDIQEQLFLAPSTPGPIVLGVGPVLSLPTATAEPFQTGTFAAGVAAVVVKDAGPFVLGALVTSSGLSPTPAESRKPTSSHFNRL